MFITDRNDRNRRSIFRNISRTLEEHLVLQDISPDLAEAIISVTGRADFEFTEVDRLFDDIISPKGQKGGEIKDADSSDRDQ